MKSTADFWRSSVNKHMKWLSYDCIKIIPLNFISIEMNIFIVLLKLLTNLHTIKWHIFITSNILCLCLFLERDDLLMMMIQLFYLLMTNKRLNLVPQHLSLTHTHVLTWTNSAALSYFPLCLINPTELLASTSLVYKMLNPFLSFPQSHLQGIQPLRLPLGLLWEEH